MFWLFSRYVLECPECGVIYRSRQFWYGNKDPVENSVRVEIKHVWPGVGCSVSYINSSQAYKLRSECCLRSNRLYYHKFDDVFGKKIKDKTM